MAERADLARPQPFEHLRRQVLQNPQDLAIASAHGDFSYRDVFDHAKRIASALRARGLRPGQVVATEVPGHLQLFFVEALFHEGCVGCTFPGPAVPSERFDWLIASMPMPGFPSSRTILADDDFLASAAAESIAIDPVDYDSFDSVCRLLFSSGTTGTPRAIPFTVARIEARSRRAERTWMPMRPFMSIIGPQAVTGMLTAYTAVASGFPYAVPGSAAESLELLERLGIRSAKASPVQLAELVVLLRSNGARGPSELLVVESAGSMLPAPLADQVRARLAPDVRNLYGSSECGTVSVGQGIGRDPHDMGVILDHVEVEVVGADDTPVANGEPGRLRWRTGEQAEGYYDDAAATAASFRDGWFYPGDVGRLTPDGHIWLEGRESEFINIGGVKLNPLSIDEFARTQPGIKDAAAFRLESDLGLPMVGLAVVASDGLDVDSLDSAFALRFGQAHLSTVFEVSEIPRNSYGKPLRLELATRYARAASS